MKPGNTARKIKKWCKKWWSGFFPRYRNKSLSSYKYLFFSAVLLLVSLWVHSYFQSFFYAVIIDHREAGLVKDREEIENYLHLLIERKENQYGMEITTGEEITFSREYRPHAEEDPLEVKRALREVSYKTVGYAVAIDGVPSVLMRSREDYRLVLEEVKVFFARRDRDNVVEVEADFKEEVHPEKMEVAPQDICTVEEAVRVLLGEGEPERSQLASREGGSSSEPLLTVKTVGEVTVEEEIPYRVEQIRDSELWRGRVEVVEPGQKGSKEVTYRVTWENGEEVNREKIGERVLENPRHQVEAVGTASDPVPASGSFIWPVKGGGDITQGYCASRHPAIDIAAGHRTPILAAHTGTVDQVKWHPTAGNYVQIKHKIDGTIYYTRYMHNDVNLVSVGDDVERGDRIALMGSTGRTYGATGIHLHFEIHRVSLYNRVNPREYVNP